MPNYRRQTIAGGTYFITQVTYQRRPWLCSETARLALRTAINQVRKKRPFTIEAIVLLPDHSHSLWTLPPNDSDLSTRLRLIKTYVTRHYAHELDLDPQLSASRAQRKERNVWQRRFWEHVIRDEHDYARHCDYIHYNPVRHEFCRNPTDWPFSSVHRFIHQGFYAPDWGQIPLVFSLPGFEYDD